MSLNEYCGQSEKATIGSVLIEKIDLKHYYKVGQEAPAHLRNHSGLLVEIAMFPRYTYFVPEDDGGTMWTMDDHGNRKARAVFKLITPLTEF